MDSSIELLNQALTTLAFGGHAGDAFGSEGPGLRSSSLRARGIASLFKSSNRSLTEGWNKAADLCDKINTLLDELVGEVHDNVQQFVWDTRAAEESAAAAVSNANSVADEILHDLGL